MAMRPCYPTLRFLSLAAAFALIGCSAVVPEPSSPVVAEELTFEQAKAALLERMRLVDAGPMSNLDALKIASAPLTVDPDGKRAEWGPFTLLLPERKYYFGILAPGRKDGHIIDFKGKFERVNGRWVATDPTNAP